MDLPAKYSTLTWQERRAVRQQYIDNQNGQCYFCSHPLDERPPAEITSKVIDWSLFPENFLKHPIHLQHDHDTDLTEGAVHAYCNAVMWQYHQK